ncbi:hypothetical protein KM043_003255 [Ampulex compressa]|nr:hypothetical protein KM043_003255 [Ampulex compressa]
MSVEASFYRNVFLLTQVATPSLEFQKYFRRRMFDEPNTMGFIYVSQYLLLLYDSKRFKRMITWPLYNKRDAVQYRVEVKKYLAILSYENPDVNFPAILMSHLILASGVKIINVLWKLSQITLRSYICRERHSILPYAPSVGTTSKLAELYLSGFNAKKVLAIAESHEKWIKSMELVENFATEKLNEIQARKRTIFEVKRRIERYIDVKPFSATVAARLLDIEDSKIINLWKFSISKGFNYLRNWNTVLQELNTISNTLCNIIESILGHSKVFKFQELPNILPDVGALFVDYEQESIVAELCTNDSLDLRAFFLLLHQILRTDVCRFNTHKLANFSRCKEQLRNISERIKLLKVEFQNLLMLTDNMLANVHYTLHERSHDATSDMGFLCVINKKILLHSPKIIFSISCCEEEKRLLNRLWSPPLKGTHKTLFKRYEREACKSPKFSLSKLCPDDNNWGSISGWTSPCVLSPIHKRASSSTMDVSPKYSRLFNVSNSRSNCFTDSITSSPKRIRLDLTPTRASPRTVGSKIRLTTVASTLLSPSCELTNAPASPRNSPKDYGPRIFGKDDVLFAVKLEARFEGDDKSNALE